MNLQQMLTARFGEQTRLRSRTKMEKGASSRRYYRLELAGTTAPARIIEMRLPPNPMAQDEISNDTPPDDLPFVHMQHHLRQRGIRVPEIYANQCSHRTVLLEDLGEDTLNRHIRRLSTDDRDQWYVAAVALLAKMHDAMWPVNTDCQAAHRQFDYSLLRWELDHYREWGAEALYNRTLPSDVRAQLDAAFDDLAATITQLPAGFVHRDYQSRNIMVIGTTPHPDHLAIIDFQDALTGPRVYDLVALLNDSYVDLPGDTQLRLIRHYANLRGLDVEDVVTEFNVVTVHRKLKDGGRFVYLDRVKNDDAFLPFVPTSFARAAAALEKVDGMIGLKTALHKTDPAWFLAP